MTCHFVKWTGTEALPDLQRLPDALIAAAQELPAWRRERYLKSRALLAEMMFYFFGYPVLPAITLSPDEWPHFIDPYLPDFSLAYAGNTLAILLSEEGKVGIDIEIVHLRPAHVASIHTQTKTPAETAWINAQSDPLEAATQLCTLRQAITKISDPELSHGDNLRLHPASGRLRSTYFPSLEAISDIDGYLAWACARTPTINHLMTWRYQGNGVMHKTGEIIQQQRQSRSYIKLTSHVTEKVPSA
ncbi:4'-phosphopantetheinyl transferase family protein [Symbiopectobacterium purcellii]|uniref:Phosphopantetheinyl transferase n=1 Tax=Symbiopectobacterium purcellii TaxID=2871826 RepID=A0ABX9ALP1_9ENTR|nr:hypothetical protein [Symbiopectobacterium purcellii]QZN95922.1 hypothetical protein K6K13_22935 [Symbiopectobacterium purcellii]